MLAWSAADRCVPTGHHVLMVGVGTRAKPILILLVAAFLVTAGAETLHAADVSADANYLWKASWREGGFYLSWMKIATIWLLFLGWVGLTDWVNRDLEETGLDWHLWNPIVVGSFLATFFLSLLIPWFWLNFFLLLAAVIAPFATYIVYRNGQMPLHRKVLTPGHLRFWFSEKMKTIGVQVASEAADANTGGVPIKAFARGGGDQATDGARLMAARQSNGLPLARKILYEGLKSRASAIVLDFAPTSVAIRYLVDGVWMPQEPIEREGADLALDALEVPLRSGAQGAACQADGQVRRGIRGAAEGELREDGQGREGVSRAGHHGTHAALGLR